MSVNKHRPHLLVLPEDDANRSLANGFLLNPHVGPQLEILPVAGGWLKVIQRCESSHWSSMRRFPERLLLLLMDFDRDARRLGVAQEQIPVELRERVFVLGVWSEPEDLKADLRSGGYESIGFELAVECRENRRQLWDHELLRHNAAELQRLQSRARSIVLPHSGDIAGWIEA